MQICTHIPIWAGWSIAKIVCCHCSSQKQQWEKIKEIQWTPGVAVREIQRQELFPSSVLSKHFILYLVTACGNHLLCLHHASIMQWEASLQSPQHSHMRGSLFNCRTLLLSLAETEVHLPRTASPHMIGHLASWSGLATATDWKQGGKKYKNIVTGAKTLQRDPNDPNKLLSILDNPKHPLHPLLHR